MNRNSNIDALRVAAAAAVVLLHVASSCMSNNVPAPDDSLAAVLNGVHLLMRWATPVFFMITGFCLTAKEQCTYSYCFSRVCRYAGVLLTVGLLYALMEEVYGAGGFDGATVMAALLRVLSGRLWDHMWFVYAIIGVYLVMPVLHLFLRSSRSNALMLTGLLGFFTVLCPALTAWLPIGIPFPFGGYLFYVCFGALVAQGYLGRRGQALCCIGGVLAACWMALSPDKDPFGYLHPLVVLMSTAIFLLALRMKICPSRRLLQWSACTWGIYLLHPLFINIAFKVMQLDMVSTLPAVKLPIFAAVVFLLSYLTTRLLRRAPYVKRLF